MLARSRRNRGRYGELWVLRIVAAIGAATVLAVGMAAQEPEVRLRDALGEAFAGEIVRQLEEAEREGLSREPLLNKAFEGIAKGESPAVVLAAVQGLVGELRAAKEVVGPEVGPIGIERAALAIRGGVDSKLLALLGRDRPGDLPILLVALQDLMDAEVERQTAEDLLRFAVSQEMATGEVLDFSAKVRRLIRAGNTPAQSAARVAQGLGITPSRRPSLSPCQ